MSQSYDTPRFLGLPVIRCNMSLGWGDQAGRCQLTVAAEKNTDPIRVSPGARVNFSYGNLSYWGILSNINRKKDLTGGEVYDVVLQDPRQLLSGAQIIINNYRGSGPRNMYNVYDYWETKEFGSSLATPVGMPYNKIITGLVTMLASTPMNFYGYDYHIDLSRLPNPGGFMVPGNNISLLDLIERVCDLGNVDYFIKLRGSVIVVYTISRNRPALPSAIEQMVKKFETQGVSSSSNGSELRLDTSSKMVIGGQVERLYNQFKNSGDSDIYQDDTVWPYWGLDYNNNVIIGRYFDQDHQVTIDGRPCTFPGVPFYHGYPTCVRELQAAMAGIDSWKLFLTIFNHKDAKNIAKKPSAGNPKEATRNVHVGKAEKMGLIGEVKDDLYAYLKENGFKGSVPKDVLNAAKRDLEYLDQNKEIIQTRIYNYIYNIATQYFGRKYMVRIPFVFANQEDETGKINTSYEPVSSGYVDQGNVESAKSMGLLPNFDQFLKDEEGKIVAYARYNVKVQGDQSLSVDLSGLSEDDFIIDGNYIFVKCTVDPNVVFLDSRNAYSPRVIVTLPAQVYLSEDEISIGPIIRDLAALIEKPIDDFLTQVGCDSLLHEKNQLPLVPDMFAIPLRDKTKTYGPWSSFGISGKIEIEQDENLVPWKFGGFDQMNAAANSLVANKRITNVVGENGFVTVADSPQYDLGDAIISSGPYISDITLNIDTNGVTTTYRFGTWNTKAGLDNKYRIEQIRKLKEEENRIKALIQKPRDRRLIRPERVSFEKRKFGKGFTPSTSSPLIVSQVINGSGTNGEDTTKISTAVMPYYNLNTVKVDNESYKNKGAASLGSLFVPFTPDHEETHIPHFEKGSGIQPNAIGLNPIGTMYEDMFEGDGYARGVALKGPLVLCSWGYDVNDDKVPASTEKHNQFASGYRNNIHLWKTGPIDLRWDDGRKVWTAKSGSSTKRVEALSGMLASRGRVHFEAKEVGSEVMVPFWLLNGLILSGQQFLVHEDALSPGDYYADYDSFTRFTVDRDIPPGSSYWYQGTEFYNDWHFNQVGISAGDVVLAHLTNIVAVTG